MKLSQLIAELQGIEKEFGDLRVLDYNDEFGVMQETHGAYVEDFKLTQNEKDFGGMEDELEEGQTVVVMR